MLAEQVLNIKQVSFSYQVHTFTTLVMRNCDWTESESVFGFDQTFDPVRDGVERMEDIEESRTRREGEIGTERIYASDSQKHTKR